MTSLFSSIPSKTSSSSDISSSDADSFRLVSLVFFGVSSSELSDSCFKRRGALRRLGGGLASSSSDSEDPESTTRLRMVWLNNAGAPASSESSDLEDAADVELFSNLIFSTSLLSLSTLVGSSLRIACFLLGDGFTSMTSELLGSELSESARRVARLPAFLGRFFGDTGGLLEEKWDSSDDCLYRVGPFLRGAMSMEMVVDSRVLGVSALERDRGSWSSAVACHDSTNPPSSLP